MKKILLLAAAFALLPAIAGAQGPYPHLTIRQVQEVSADSMINATNLRNPALTTSYYLGDTVWVTGVVTIPPRNPQIGGTVLFTGDRFRLMIQDPNEPEWGAMTIVSEDTNLTKATNGIDNALEGDSISVLGVVTEFRTLTQINMLRVDTAFVFRGSGTVLPPRELSLPLFSNGTNSIWYDGEKYESALVTMRDLTVIDILDPYFTLADLQNNQIRCDDESNELFEAYGVGNVPPPGAKIDAITGFMGVGSDLGWELNPRGLSDIVVGFFAPAITGVERSLATPTGSDSVKVSVDISDQDGSVASAALSYSVNGGSIQQAAMSQGSGNIWMASIPPALVDSALVTYFIEAIDNEGHPSLEPPDTASNRYFYFVLNRPVRIYELQYTPFAVGRSAYEGYRVTVDGVVTADRSQDFSEVYLQDGNAPWSGILLFSRTGADSVLRRGDHITVSGRVTEFNDKTEIDSTEFVVNTRSNPVPEAVPVLTSQVKTGGLLAEQYESMLVKLQSVYIVNINSDANQNNNFGEWEISEDSTAVAGLRIDDKGVISGHVSYDNDILRAPFGTIQLYLRDSFESITGILDFTFDNVKLQPRNDSDFVGHNSVVSVGRDESVIPASFLVHQNYPNPFNPTTDIRYEIPRASHVTVKVYNLLGQLIATLVDGFQDAGGYRVSFGSVHLPSGVYFYRVTAGDYVAIKKMLLVK